MDSSGSWYLWLSSEGYQRNGPYALGVCGTPLLADFDGDHKSDPAVYSSGSWNFWLSGNGYQRLCMTEFLGTSGYLPAAGDCDGDEKADPAVISLAGDWQVKFSTMSYVQGGPYSLGLAGTPLLADFDADGLADPAVVDGAGNWYVWFSSQGYYCGGPYALTVP
jgi:hypothetical protein